MLEHLTETQCHHLAIYYLRNSTPREVRILWLGWAVGWNRGWRSAGAMLCPNRNT